MAVACPKSLNSIHGIHSLLGVKWEGLQHWLREVKTKLIKLRTTWTKILVALVLRKFKEGSILEGSKIKRENTFTLSNSCPLTLESNQAWWGGIKDLPMLKKCRLHISPLYIFGLESWGVPCDWMVYAKDTQKLASFT